MALRGSNRLCDLIYISLNHSRFGVRRDNCRSSLQHLLSVHQPTPQRYQLHQVHHSQRSDLLRNYLSTIATMADNSDAPKSTTEGDNVTPAAAATSTSSLASTQQSSERTNDNQSKSNSNNNEDEGKKSSKQRKASRWKALNKKKKEQKRARLGLGPDANQTEYANKKLKPNLHWKKEYDDDDKVVLPHEGSFAHECMQKTFGVSVDLKLDGDDGRQDKKDAVADDSTAADNSDSKVASASTSASDASTAEKTTDVVADNNNNNTTTEEDSNKKVPKRKLAMLVSFLGKDYSGFQINTNMHTLQAEIELALYRSGIISGRNFGHPSKYSWSNSARTDKGVHAAAQVCSLKGEMIYHTSTSDDSQESMRENLDAMRMKVNEYLPEDIRVLDFERVTRMFCARTSRDKVRYQYMVPSYMLSSREDVKKAFANAEAVVTKPSGDNMTPMLAKDIVQEKIDSHVLEEARAALINHRVTPEQMEKLRNGLKLFEGTHCFHNYTRRVGADNASSTRYILSFVPLNPIIVTGSVNEDGSKQPDTQWIPLQVVGQSFLLNQIRKMVSAAADLARGSVSQERIEQSLTKEHRMKINVAPAQGLFLDRSFFELYNKHKANNAPDRVTLDWVEKEGEEMPSAVRRIEEFKNEKVIPHIVKEEADEGNFLQYLYQQDILYPDEIYTDR